jgi:hypothetical protein
MLALRPRPDGLTHRSAGQAQGCELRPLGAIDRRGHRDDEHIRRREIGRVGAQLQPGGQGLLEFFAREFTGAVVPLAQLLHPGGIHVVADHPPLRSLLVVLAKQAASGRPT